MYKKIAFGILALAFLVIIAGFFYFNNQNKENKNQANTQSEVVNKVAENIQEEKKVEVIDIQEVIRPKEVVENIIQKETRVKKKEIREAAKGRRYTDEEIDFILNPRKNTIEDLIEKGEVSEAEVDSLD